MAADALGQQPAAGGLCRPGPVLRARRESRTSGCGRPLAAARGGRFMPPGPLGRGPGLCPGERYPAPPLPPFGYAARPHRAWGRAFSCLLAAAKIPAARGGGGVFPGGMGAPAPMPPGKTGGGARKGPAPCFVRALRARRPPRGRRRFPLAFLCHQQPPPRRSPKQAARRYSAYRLPGELKEAL